MTPLRDGRKLFTFKITYFKPSGKFYTHDEVEWEIAACGNGHTAYMYDAVAKLRGLRDNGGQGALPGLNSGKWEGPILIDCEEGFPCLLMPRDNQ